MSTRISEWATRVRFALILWLPVLLVFFGVGLVAEASHAQPTYATHYTNPSDFGSTSGESQYAAHLNSRGWQTFSVDAHNHISLRQFNDRGGLLFRRELDGAANYQSTPSMDWSGRRGVGAWVGSPGANVQPLRVAIFTNGKVKKILSVTHRGYVANPFVFHMAGGRFGVVFSWQHPQGNYDIYSLTVAANNHVGQPILIARSPTFGFYPRAAWNGKAVDLMYFELCCQGHYLHLILQPLSSKMKPRPYSRILDRITEGSTPPTQWGVDIQSAPRNQVLAAWIGGGVIKVASFHSAKGQVRVQAVAPIDLDPTAPAVSIHALASGSVVYFSTIGTVHTVVDAVQLTDSLNPKSLERVSFDADGDAANPIASARGSIPHVMWEKIGDSGATPFEASAYTASPRVTLVDRLGLGIGNPVEDVVLLSAAGLGAAFPLTIINSYLVLPLILIWLPLGRFLSERRAWPLYVVVVAAVLALVFIVPSVLNHWTFVLGSVGEPTALAAVVGGLACGLWFASVGMRDQESMFRVAVLVFVTFYFVSAMWTIGQLETHLTLV